MKICTQCKKEKPLEDFVKNAGIKSGRGAICKICNCEKSKKYNKEHKEERRAYSIKYNDKNREYLRALWRNYGNPDFPNRRKTNKRKNYNEIRKLKLDYNRVYKKNNPDIVIKSRKQCQPRRNQQTKEREAVDLAFKIKRRLRHRINVAVTIGNKSFTTQKLLGCSLDFFLKWIERNFEHGMTWDNYGYGHDKWHLDHNLPCASFDLTNPEQQKQCFHWSNLFPMWQKHNFAKKDDLWIADYQI